MTDIPKYEGWRQRFEGYMRKGYQLEQRAMELGLKDLVEVRPDWGPPALDYCEFNGSLEQFTRMEPYVRAIYGPGVPDRDRDQVESMLQGYGRSCGYGPGPLSAATSAARKIAHDLEQLGWNVILDADDGGGAMSESV